MAHSSVVNSLQARDKLLEQGDRYILWNRVITDDEVEQGVLLSQFQHYVEPLSGLPTGVG